MIRQIRGPLRSNLWRSESIFGLFKSTLYSTSSWINTWSRSNFRTTIPNYVYSHCTNSPLLATRKYDPGRIFTLMCRYRVGMRRKNRPNEISIHSKKLMSWKSASTSSLVLVNNSDFPTITHSNSECLRVQYGPMQRRLDITNSTFRSTLYHVLLHIFMHSVPGFQHHLAIFDKVIGI